MAVSFLNVNIPKFSFKALIAGSNNEAKLKRESIHVLHKRNNGVLPLRNNQTISSFHALYPVQYIETYVNPTVVQKAVDTNPNISKILAEYGLEPQISLENINSNAKNHLFSTYMYSKDIAKLMQLDKKSSLILFQAALLHDIGKALIPEEIIQKPGKLTPYERKIVDLHAQLGYEILKTTDVPKEVAEAVRTHHTPITEKPDDRISQILSVADVYSALREERAYKPVLDHDKTCSIMTESKELAQHIVQELKFAKFHA